MKKIYLLIALILFLPALIQAGSIPYGQMAHRELSLAREYVKSASYFLESSFETPWPASVILAEDLHRFGWETLGQVLEYQPSFYLAQDLNKKVVALRGVYFFETSNFLFLEHGFRLNGPGFESFEPFWNYPLARIGRIEILRGSGSSLYGDASLSGVISLEPKEKERASLGVLFGNREGRGGWLGVQAEWLRFFASYFDRRGEKIDLPPAEDYALHPAPGEYLVNETPDNYHLALDLGREPLRLLYRRMRFKESGPATLLGQNITPEDLLAGQPYSHTLEDLLGLEADLRFRGWRFEGRAYYTRSQKENLFLTATAREFPEIFFQEKIIPLNARVEYDFERYSLEGLIFKVLPRHRILLGAKWEETNYQDAWARIYFPENLRFFLRRPQGVFRGEAESQHEGLYALFGEWKWSPNPRLHLNIGGRYEYFEAFGGRFSPRLSLTWRLLREGSLVLTYTRAYQSVPYLFRILTKYHGGQDDFPFQRSDQVNLSFRLRPETGLTIFITFFYQWFRDLVRSDPTNYLRYSPTGRWEEAGLEMELAYRTPKLSAFLNYSFYEITENHTPNKYWSLICGNRIAGIPKWMIKGGISFRPFETIPFFVSPLFRYYGRAVKKDFFNSHWTSPYGVVDLNLLWEGRSFRMSFKVENLFDHHFKRGGLLPPLPQPGRTFWFRLEFHF